LFLAVGVYLSRLQHHPVLTISITSRRCYRRLQALKGRLSKKGKMPSRKAHKLTQYKECKAAGLTEEACYKKVRCVVMSCAWLALVFMCGVGFVVLLVLLLVLLLLLLYIVVMVYLLFLLLIITQISALMDEFFGLRSFMWPTFAGNGFDLQSPK